MSPFSFDSGQVFVINDTSCGDSITSNLLQGCLQSGDCVNCTLQQTSCIWSKSSTGGFCIPGDLMGPISFLNNSFTGPSTASSSHCCALDPICQTSSTTTTTTSFTTTTTTFIPDDIPPVSPNSANCQLHNNTIINSIVVIDHMAPRVVAVFRNCDGYSNCEEAVTNKTCYPDITDLDCGICGWLSSKGDSTDIWKGTFHVYYDNSSPSTEILLVSGDDACTIRPINNNSDRGVYLWNQDGSCQPRNDCSANPFCDECISRHCIWCYDTSSCGYDSNCTHIANTTTGCLTPQQTMNPQINSTTGIKRISTVEGEHFLLWNGSHWNGHFFIGGNVGATIPGSNPGDLNLPKWVLISWFQAAVDMGVDDIRVYTLLPPSFYETFSQFNSGRSPPLYLFQGIWSPDEQLAGDGDGTDAFDSLSLFLDEVDMVVNALHGNITIPLIPGKASAHYSCDVSPYLVGWIVGTEWYERAVHVTNIESRQRHPHHYHGHFFYPLNSARNFEVWLSLVLDSVASIDHLYNWSRPIAFTNWVTTDPLSHPLEPYPETEDYMDVDPMRIQPTLNWTGGYFSSYHAYPYYPDSLRFEYVDCKDCRGNSDPYSGYIRELRTHHAGIPLVISEFGVSTSRASAHAGPLGRSQGGVEESDQGNMLVDIFVVLYEEGCAGGLIFALFDEWFKRSWNNEVFETPEARPFWYNLLSPEQVFGVIAIEPGQSEQDKILLDGNKSDWSPRNALLLHESNFTLHVTHDPAAIYLLLYNFSGVPPWLSNQSFVIGFDTIRGLGANRSSLLPDVLFDIGMEFLLHITNNSVEFLVFREYDSYYWFNSPFISNYKSNFTTSIDGFNILRNSLSYPLFVDCEELPLEWEDLGRLKFGTNNPNSAQFRSIVDWYSNEETLEIRLPLGFFGFLDPGANIVHNYLTPEDFLTVHRSSSKVLQYLNMSTTIPGILIQAQYINFDGAVIDKSSAKNYTWTNWNSDFQWHQRKKASFHILAERLPGLISSINSTCNDSTFCKAATERPHCTSSSSTTSTTSFTTTSSTSTSTTTSPKTTTTTESTTTTLTTFSSSKTTSLIPTTTPTLQSTSSTTTQRPGPPMPHKQREKPKGKWMVPAGISVAAGFLILMIGGIILAVFFIVHRKHGRESTVSPEKYYSGFRTAVSGY